jgi:hypothetical protein
MFLFSPRIGSPVTIAITTTIPDLKRCFCQLISKGDSLVEKAITFKNQTATFTFIPTFAYAPRSEIIFFSISSSGTIISSQLTINLNDTLPNYVM